MKEHIINSLDNFICGWYMDDTSVCDELIKYQSVCDDKDFGRVTINNELVVDTSQKDSIDCNLGGPSADVYYKHLFKCMDEYVKKYSYCNNYGAWNIIERANIQYYPPKAGYHIWHAERTNGNFPISNRHLVFMTYLNDVTDGGETEWFYQKSKVAPEKGLTIIWPADWTFTHRGVASPTQDKYIVTGWFNYIMRE